MEKGKLPTNDCLNVLYFSYHAYHIQQVGKLHQVIDLTLGREKKTSKTRTVSRLWLLISHLSWLLHIGVTPLVFKASIFQLRIWPYDLRMMTSHCLLNFCISTYKYTENSSIFQLVGYWEQTGICQHAITRAQKQISPLSFPTARLGTCQNRYLPHQASSLPQLTDLCWTTTTAHHHFFPHFLIHSPLMIVPKSLRIYFSAWWGSTAYAAS